MIEEFCPSDIANVEEQGNGAGKELGTSIMVKRKIKVYGLSKQKQDIKHIERTGKENMKTDSINIQETGSGDREKGTWWVHDWSDGHGYLLLILAVFVVWKIAVQ